MQGSRWVRYAHIIIDALMGLDLVALLSTYGREDVAHEYLGVVMFVLFLAHQGLNWRWWVTRFQGPYRPWRVVDTAMDVLLVIGMIGLIVSSLVLSDYAFSWLPVIPGEEWARSLHMVCSFWFFLLAFIHMGLHMRIPEAWRTTAGTSVLAIISVAILVGAIITAINLRFPEYMLLRTTIVAVDYVVPLWMMFLQNALIAVSAAITGSWISTLLGRPHPRSSSWAKKTAPERS